MLLLQNLVFWAALSGAVFPLSASAGEWEEYLALKASLVVSKPSQPAKPLPIWLRVEEWQPRPHFRLDAVKVLTDFDKKSDRPSDEKPVSSPLP